MECCFQLRTSTQQLNVSTCGPSKCVASSSSSASSVKPSALLRSKRNWEKSSRRRGVSCYPPSSSSSSSSTSSSLSSSTGTWNMQSCNNWNASSPSSTRVSATRSVSFSSSSSSSSSAARAFTYFSEAELSGGKVGILKEKKSSGAPDAESGDGGGDNINGNDNNNNDGNGGSGGDNNSNGDGSEESENEADDSGALSISSASTDGSIPTSKVEQLCKEHQAPLPADMLTMIRTSNGVSTAVLMRWFDLATSKSFFMKHVVSRFAFFRNRALMDASFSRRLFTDISIDVALLSFIEFMRVRARSSASSSSSSSRNSQKSSTVSKKKYKKSGEAASASPSFWDEWEFFACDILASIGMNAAIVSLVSPAIRTRGSIGLNAFTATRKRGRSVAFLTVSAQVGACCYAMGFVMQTLAEVLYDARTSPPSSLDRDGKTATAHRVGKQFGSFAATSSSPRQHAVLVVERYLEKKVAGAAMVTASVLLRASNAVYGSREFQKQQRQGLIA